MPPDKSGPPLGKAARDVTAPATALDASTVAAARDSGRELAAPSRRRRAAAGRLPPLPDGRRDPLDDLAGLPVRIRPDCCPGEFGPDGWQPHCRGAA